MRSGRRIKFWLRHRAIRAGRSSYETTCLGAVHEQSGEGVVSPLAAHRRCHVSRARSAGRGAKAEGDTRCPTPAAAAAKRAHANTFAKMAETRREERSSRAAARPPWRTAETSA